jgi:hypothetical protein
MKSAVMTTRRVTRGPLVLAIVLLCAASWPSGASAQTTATQTPTVSLTLLAQTPWTTLSDPALRIAVVASNTGRARIGDLAIGVTLGDPIISRFQYETSLTEGPGTTAFTTSIPFRGHLDPGEAETFTVTIDLSTVEAVSETDTRIYPLQLDVRSNDVPIASLNSAAIHIIRTPEAPMAFSWWLELAEGPIFGPDGRLVEASVEAGLSPGGSLAASLEGLGSLIHGRGPRAPIDLAVQPSLLEDLRRMSTGYVRADGREVDAGDGASGLAASFLADLAATAETDEVQLSASPFAGPSLPALLRNGLGFELEQQRAAGDGVVEDTIDITPAISVARPPGGMLDDATLGWLAANGVTAVLADDDEVDRPLVGDNLYAPSPTATMRTAGGDATTLVLPDPGTTALLRRPDLLADPVRAAQAVLGELAVVWREQPVPGPQADGTPTVRGVAVALPSTLPPTVWRPLFERLAEAPFLQPMHAQDFVAAVSPPGPDARLRAPDDGAFSPSYAESIRSLGRDVEAFESMLTEPGQIPDRLQRDLMFAASARYLDDETAGRRWLDSVGDTVGGAFTSTTPTVNTLFTFTSGEGSIPLRMGDPGSTPLAVTVELQSAQFDFPDGAVQDIVLERPAQIVTFRVVAKAAGQNPIQVIVRAPSGRPISEQTITVRSTALNRIALLVTAGAGGVLLLLYSRRWVRRRTTPV